MWPKFLMNEQCVYVWLIVENLRASQRIEEIRESLVPSVRVIQVTGVTCSFHHHHAVIGEIAQVAERQFSELNVLVTVNDE